MNSSLVPKFKYEVKKRALMPSFLIKVFLSLERTFRNDYLLWWGNICLKFGISSNSRQFLFVLLNTSKITLNISYFNNTSSTISVSIWQKEQYLNWSPIWMRLTWGDGFRGDVGGLFSFYIFSYLGITWMFIISIYNSNKMIWSLIFKKPFQQDFNDSVSQNQM